MEAEEYGMTGYHNGHYKGSGEFTSLQNEAAEFLRFIKPHQITSVGLLYRQSMGSEIGIE
jgi:hypothetical protein